MILLRDYFYQNIFSGSLEKYFLPNVSDGFGSGDVDFVIVSIIGIIDIFGLFCLGLLKKSQGDVELPPNNPLKRVLKPKPAL